MYSFLPILIILTALTYQLCSALALGNLGMGNLWLGPRPGPGTALVSTQLVTWAASYNEIR